MGRRARKGPPEAYIYRVTPVCLYYSWITGCISRNREGVLNQAAHSVILHEDISHLQDLTGDLGDGRAKGYSEPSKLLSPLEKVVQI